MAKEYIFLLTFLLYHLFTNSTNKEGNRECTFLHILSLSLWPFWGARYLSAEQFDPPPSHLKAEKDSYQTGGTQDRAWEDPDLICSAEGCQCVGFKSFKEIKCKNISFL